jgi:hypothetical protein
MASVLKLKTDIKKLKAAIASKATSGAIKTKLRGKLTSLENELDKLQPNKRKPKTTGPKSESALVKLAKKRRTNQNLSTSKSDIERDAIRPAKKAGKRISASGNTYYEYRDNRIDNRQPPRKYRKLADGGNTSDFDELIADKFKMQEWYENFNDGLKNLVTKKYVTKAELNKFDNYSSRRRIDPYEKYGKMSGRSAAKKFVDDNKRYDKMADGGELMTDKQTIAKLKKKFAKYQGNDFDFDEDNNFKVDGYNVEVFDYKEEDEMNDYIVMNSKDNYLVPWNSDDDNFYLIVVPKHKMADGGMMASGGMFSTKEDNEVVDKAYRDKLVEYIYKKYSDKSINGFELSSGAFNLEGNFLWENKAYDNLLIYITPFFTPDNDISYEKYVDEDLVERKDQPYKLTGDLDKDADTYIKVVESKTKKYTKGKMADGGKTQGYDDKKDESLGMTRGKLSLKDFVGNRKQKEHSRRDDARFEERGEMADGGEVKSLKTSLMDKVKECEDIIDKIALNYKEDSKSMEALTDALQMLSRSGRKVIIYTNNEDLKEMSHGGYMAKGGKTKDQEVVRGYFEDEAYEYGSGGEVKSLQRSLMDKVEECEVIIDKLAVLYKEDSKSREALTDALQMLSRSGRKVIIYTNNQDLKEMAHGGVMANGGEVGWKKAVTIKRPTKAEAQKNAKLLADYYGNSGRNFKVENRDDKYVVTYEFNLSDKMDHGGMMEHGGSVAEGNYEMLMSQAKEVMHHAEELMQVVKPNMDIEAWVVSKAERATTDLSDITHYLDGLKMAMGGMVKHNAHKVNG